jgi:hypothetical protein
MLLEQAVVRTPMPAPFFQAGGWTNRKPAKAARMHGPVPKR